MLARQPGSAWRLIRDCLPAFQLEQDLPSHTGRLFVGRGGRQLATPFSTSIEDPNEHVPLRDDETGTQQSISEPPVEASSLNASILANVGVDDRDQEGESCRLFSPHKSLSSLKIKLSGLLHNYSVKICLYGFSKVSTVLPSQKICKLAILEKISSTNLLLRGFWAYKRHACS